ncbi:MAG: prepilin-type N-terminal cleavage/methylation domain-containing protein [Magnetococcales bacterium]|nr:prepilin-type N-terminal cleavage/methylation domain-containing protein [Magnetococcales bacterium]
MIGLQANSNRGFTLIEMVIIIVLLGVSAVGMIPLFTQVLTSAHEISELHQGQLLAQERIEEVVAARRGAAGFSGLTEALFASERGIDLGGAVRFDRLVQVEGGVFDSVANTLRCSGWDYNNEEYKCVIVEVRTAGEGRILSQRRALFAR